MAPIGGLHGSIRCPARNMNALPSPRFITKAQIKTDAADQVIVQPNHQDQLSSSRRAAALGLAATAGLMLGCAFDTKDAALAATAKPIKLGPPPPPSGGLPGTLNSDQARDFDLPLKNRFYLQPLKPTEAAARVKESAEDIIGVKSLIEKKAWPYVMNDLRSKGSYLRYDLKTIIDSKSKEEKKPLADLTSALLATIDKLDYAAKTKNSAEAEKYYAETKSALDSVLSKLG